MHSFRPRVAATGEPRDLLYAAAHELSGVSPEGVESVRTCVLGRAGDLALCEAELLELRLALSVLCDLRAHDWEIIVGDDAVQVSRPDRRQMVPDRHKRHIRESFLIERDAQLREPATRRFIERMERHQRHGNAFRSVLSLLRDGVDLAEALDRARRAPDGPKRAAALREAIDPYVQVVESGTACAHTGLDLQDIWRYFRHTWVTPYRSVPGRQISFLIRDRAAPNHPIIGIGSLASAVVQQESRDKWIGWHPDAFVEALEKDGYRGWPRWIEDKMRELLADTYREDFLSEGLLTPADLESPSEDVIRGLRQVARDARDAHRLYRQESQHKRAGVSEGADWRGQAETFLFRSKRAGRLADLLRARLDLQRGGFTKPSPARLRRAAATSAGRRALRTIIRLVKAGRVGIDMMDISVCGAVDPYRPILGGKLVSLLLASPDTIRAYNIRYSDSASIIASSMAGRAVRRSPRLALLMTTSLYSVASSQYNRLRVPAEAHGGAAELRYIDLAHTAGFGSYHFSATTMDVMEVLLARAENGREVNSIFGEGVNPKLRKVRGALEAIGLSSEYLLRHGSKRIVYAVPLATNFRDVLIGRAGRPKYAVPLRAAGTQALIDFWLERWLSGRIARKGVLEAVAKHGTAYPIEHGARVRLPPEDEPDSLGPLFE